MIYHKNIEQQNPLGGILLLAFPLSQAATFISLFLEKYYRFVQEGVVVGDEGYLTLG